MLKCQFSYETAKSIKICNDSKLEYGLYAAINMWTCKCMHWVHIQTYHVTIHVTAVECLTNRSHKNNILLDSAKPSHFSLGGGYWK